MTTTTLEAVKASVRNLGYEATDVENSPVELVNVWANDSTRIPAATIIHDVEEGRFEWGAHWEHHVADTLTAHAVAIAVERTLYGLGVDQPLTEEHR